MSQELDDLQALFDLVWKATEFHQAASADSVRVVIGHKALQRYLRLWLSDRVVVDDLMGLTVRIEMSDSSLGQAEVQATLAEEPKEALLAHGHFPATP